MARVKSPEKRSAILQAAVHEIATAGLGAPTAKIARRAGVAAGTLFTYFPNKKQLLNELKGEVYARVNAKFPHKGNLERRARHIWSSYLDWSIEFPEKRKVSVQLNVSDLITPATRMRTAAERGRIDGTLSELETRSALRGLPAGFAAATMSAMREATIEFIAKQPKRREKLIEQTFQVF